MYLWYSLLLNTQDKAESHIPCNITHISAAHQIHTLVNYTK